MSKKLEFLIGTDPEVFVKDRENRFLSGHGVIEGTKECPFFIGQGFVQLDGVALEFNTIPSASRSDFLNSIKGCMNYLSDKAGEKGLFIEATPTALFNKDYFNNLPEDVKLLGCMPDFDAWKGGVQKESPCADRPFRTGAGHIHVGWGDGYIIEDPYHMNNCIDAVKQLDTVLYITAKMWDNDVTRKELYGSVGSFRPKYYGVEYRPLSNAYLRKDKTIEWVFDATMKSMDLLFNEDIKLYEIYDINQEVIDSINPWEMNTRMNEDFGIPLYEE